MGAVLDSSSKPVEVLPALLTNRRNVARGLFSQSHAPLT